MAAEITARFESVAARARELTDHPPGHYRYPAYVNAFAAMAVLCDELDALEAELRAAIDDVRAAADVVEPR